MLSAITPYKVWMIVVLVSSISFVGYVLVKVLGASSGIGLTVTGRTPGTQHSQRRWRAP